MKKAIYIIALVLLTITIVILYVSLSDSVSDETTGQISEIDRIDIRTSNEELDCLLPYDTKVGKVIDLPNERLKKLEGPFIYYTDTCNVYLGTQDTFVILIPNADPKTFVSLIAATLGNPCETPDDIGCVGVRVAKDSRAVYDSGKVIEGADSSSFKLLTLPDGRQTIYGADKNYVYNLHGYTDGTHKVKNASPSTFYPIDEITGKDGNRVWVKGELK